MRKTWFVIAAVLLAAAPLAARQPNVQWAAAYTGGVPKAAPSGTTYVLLPTGQAVPANAPVAVLAVPVAVQPPAPPPPQPACAGGHCAEHQPCDWQHVRDWLCYHSLRGGCPKGSCGCNCSTPLYVYFLHECKEGRHFDLPPCAYEKEKPGIFRSMCRDGCGMVRSCGTTAAPCPAQTEPAVSYGAAYQAVGYRP